MPSTVQGPGPLDGNWLMHGERAERRRFPRYYHLVSRMWCVVY